MTTSETSLTPALRSATRATPLLSAPDEQRLARAARDGDTNALDTLLRSHFRLVFAIAREHSRGRGRFEDLVGEGMLGLTQAARRFDPERGVRFAVYAALWIRAYVRAYTLRDRGVVRMPSTRNSRTVLAHLREAQTKLRRNTWEEPTSAELARELGVSESDVDEVVGSLNARSIPLGAELHGRAFELASSDPSPEELVCEADDQRQQAASIARALNDLTPRERHVLERRGLSDTRLSLVEVGRELGLSNERVRQIEACAKDKLRRHMQALSLLKEAA